MLVVATRLSGKAWNLNVVFHPFSTDSWMRMKTVDYFAGQLWSDCCNSAILLLAVWVKKETVVVVCLVVVNDG